jgi:RNA polymerase sigma factor (sigma-70 family)
MERMESEQELLQQLKKGDEFAWNEAFGKLYPIAFHAAKHPSASLSPSECEDAAVETLSDLVHQIQSIPDFDQLKALTAAIAYRKSISMSRKKYAAKRGGNQTQSLDELFESLELADGALNDLSDMELAELSQLLSSILASLEEPGKSILKEFLVEGAKYRDLSEKYRVPMGTVGVLISRSLKKIQQQLNQSPKLVKELRQFLR